jgi:hypothetical protein
MVVGNNHTVTPVVRRCIASAVAAAAVTMAQWSWLPHAWQLIFAVLAAAAAGQLSLSQKKLAWITGA